MPYAILYQVDAKADLEANLADYGTKFREDVTAWITELATKAEAGDYSLSFDYLELVDAALETESKSWRHSIRRFVQANAKERFWAFIAFIRHRRPPWELRAVSRAFWVVDAFPCQITAFVEINHSEKRIVFRHFKGLPSQG
jgi:hypothetical protein